MNKARIANALALAITSAIAIGGLSMAYRETELRKESDVRIDDLSRRCAQMERTAQKALSALSDGQKGATATVYSDMRGGSSSGNAVVQQIAMGLRTPAGTTDPGEFIGNFLVANRNRMFPGDDGELGSLIGSYVSAGHDNGFPAAPHTRIATGQVIKIKDLTGLIDVAYGLHVELIAGPTGRLGHGWGVVVDSPRLDNCFEGKTAFGGHADPRDAIDLQDGMLGIQGSPTSTLRLRALEPATAVKSDATPRFWWRVLYGNVPGYIPVY